MNALIERVKKIVNDYIDDHSVDDPFPIKCTKDELDLVWQQRRENIPYDSSSCMTIESKDLIKALLIRMTSVSNRVMAANVDDDLGDDECIFTKCIRRRRVNSKFCAIHREVSITKSCFNFINY